jgi:hypothetical protein
VIRSQQQQVVSRAEARMFEHAQRATTSRMFQPRLTREHFA